MTRDIVLMEDDELLRTIIVEGLQDAGYRVSEVATGAEALARLDTMAPPRLLIADRKLSPTNEAPNGFQVAADALARYADLKVIYVSGTHLALRHRQITTRERVLYKPFAISKLVEMLRDLQSKN